MSFNLLVFEPDHAPTDRPSFLVWFANQSTWSEGHSYDDPQVSSQRLQVWFSEFAEKYPPMNGPLAVDDDRIDDPAVTDHCVGRSVIYSAFSYSVADKAYLKMKKSALQHGLGFFDTSRDNGELLFPSPNNKPTEK